MYSNNLDPVRSAPARASVGSALLLATFFAALVSQAAEASFYFGIKPSVVSTHVAPYALGVQYHGFIVGCYHNTGEPIPNVGIQVSWLAQGSGGGHLHYAGRPPGIIFFDNAGSGFNPETYAAEEGSISYDDNDYHELSLITGGSGELTLVMVVPEASGPINIDANCFGGPYDYYTPDHATFDVNYPGLGWTYAPLLNVDTYSHYHDGQNGYSDGQTQAALSNAMSKYAGRCPGINALKPGPYASTVRVTAASLPQGGVFDYDPPDWAGKATWTGKHHSHRFGYELDIVPPSNVHDRTCLALSLSQALFQFPVRTESPPLYTDHWHAVHKPAADPEE